MKQNNHRKLITYNKDCFSSVKREKEVECKVNLSYHEQDVQKIGDINYLTRLNIACFPKQINVSYQTQLSYRSTNHAF